MAYGLMLLRAAPMLLTAAAVNYDYAEYIFTRPFVLLANRPPSEPNSLGHDRRAVVNRFLQHYVHDMFPPAFHNVILVLYPLSWLSTAAILTVASGPAAGSTSLLPRLAAAVAAPLSRASWRLYAAGCALNFAHMFWGPYALALMQEMGSLGSHAADSGKRVASETQDDNTALMDKWIRMHVARSVAVDVPSFLCFTAAFFLSRPFR